MAKKTKEQLNLSSPQNAIVGHTAQRTFIKNLLQSKHLPASMMFVGPKGIGKQMVGRELAKSIFCENAAYGGCDVCKACHVFEAGNHPDFHFLQFLDKDQGSVERVRDLLYSLNLNPFSGSHRVVLFDNADHMSLQIANILLKTLEEPRPNTFFILTCASKSKLPQTLVSRCQVWFFDTLTHEELEQVIQKWHEAGKLPGIDSDQLRDIAEVADGSLGGIESIIENIGDWISIKEQLVAVAGGSISEALQLAQTLSKDKDQLKVFIQFLRIIARNQMYLEDVEESRARWALFLSNILSAERLLFERNLGAYGVMLIAITGLLPQKEFSQFTQFSNSATVLDRICL